LPANVLLGEGSSICGANAFKRFLAKVPQALTLADHSSAVDVGFAIGVGGIIRIGSYCYLNACTLLSESEIRIGDYVMIGWGTTISDTDFHPLDPAERIRDAIALSPASRGQSRPEIKPRAVIIGDDVFIGPACTILKGVSIGNGAFIEPGSVITRNVPAHARMRGNPAAIMQDEIAK
jgi:acetyltransferase-like isoleucine patch superfamily enzyme